MAPPTVSDTADPLQAWFAANGATEQLASNRPLFLDQLDGVWLVQSGGIDLFYVQQRDGEPSSHRTHLLRVAPGALLVGLPESAGAGAYRLLVAGLVGTSICGIDAPQLSRLLADPAAGPLATRALEHWLTELSTGLAPPLNLTHFTALTAGQAEAFSEPVSLRPEKGLVWARLEEGQASFCGTVALDDAAREHWFPLTGQTWLETHAAARLRITDTAGALAADNPLPTVQSLAMFALYNQIPFSDARHRTEDSQQLTRRETADRRALQQTMRGFQAILDPELPAEGAARAADTDPWLAACRMIAVGHDLQFNAPPATARPSGTRLGPLTEILKVSRVRMRVVLLRGQWWSEDCGPLLATIGEGDDLRPVALIPRGHAAYTLHDPASGESYPLGRQQAEKLDMRAYMFYRPLPDRVLSGIDILRFCSPLGRDDLKLILTMGLLSGLLGLLIPIATGYIIDTLIPSADRFQLYHVTAGLVMVASAISVFGLVRGLASLRLSTINNAALQAAVIDRVVSLPAPFFSRYNAGDLTERVMGISLIREMLSGPTLTSLIGSIVSACNLALLLYYDLKLAGIAILLVLINVLLSFSIGWFQLRRERQRVEIAGKLSGLVFQLITGLPKLRLAGTESRAFAAWGKRYRALREQLFKIGGLQYLGLTINGAYSLLTTMAVFAAMIYFEGDSQLSTGRFIAFNAAFGSFMAGTLSLSATLLQLLQILPLYERVKPILQTVPEVSETGVDPGPLTGRIEVSHASFRYDADGPLVLDDVSIEARAGEMIAIVGSSGSGKSTLMRLLLGFEKAESGSIYFDGQDLAALDVRGVRRQMGVVLQAGQLMPGDIYSNIVGSSPYLTQEDATAAVKMAGMQEDIEQMPMGLHTVVSEGGGGLSGGQRQRLLIARALVNRPRIIFFDEATSALDNATQQLVSRSLEQLNATRIVIAHRLSTIRHADRIYVLEQGRVVEQGSYSQLIEQDGRFAELARRQTA